jgi:hypothetical protein
MSEIKISKIFSSEDQLKKIANILTGYLKLPFSKDSIPGTLMEDVIGSVRTGKVLNTYDFVDVIKKDDKVGWQVKSTKASTPVTWKRAKIPNAEPLISASHQNLEGSQLLGNAIIKFCNDHVMESLKLYDLTEIGYSRLIVHNDGSLTYFEKLLCDRSNPKIFNEEEFIWKWSRPKKTIKKEQLPSLHGFNKTTRGKWFAWHGLGENQLHFSGEKVWWPQDDNHKIDFSFPSSRLSLQQFMNILEKISSI